MMGSGRGGYVGVLAISVLAGVSIGDFIENQKKKYQGKACQGSCML